MHILQLDLNNKKHVDDLLHLPYLVGTITDSHFVERDRMGRLVTFLARILQDGWADQARGIGIDGKTALAVDGNGVATLHGEGALYFLHTTTFPEHCQKNDLLTFRDVDVFRLTGVGSTFDLAASRYIFIKRNSSSFCLIFNGGSQALASTSHNTL